MRAKNTITGEKLEKIYNNKRKATESSNSSIIIKIRCKYIIEKIFNLFTKKRVLKFLRYNKKILNKMNMSINDYKNYYEEYSVIEFEIFTVKNKFSKFINIKPDEKKYFHIYFNNKKIESEIYETNEYMNIYKIRILIEHEVKSFKGLFSNCVCIKSIRFKKFARKNIKDMSHMFSHCYSLKKIDFGNFNTENVTYMNSMFKECAFLKKIINLKIFNTNKVENMESMFYNCLSIKELDLSSFNTANVKDMRYMFMYCLSLKKLKTTDFKINLSTQIFHMFYFCSNKTNIFEYRSKKKEYKIYLRD